MAGALGDKPLPSTMSSETRVHKRRKVRRKLQRAQNRPRSIELASQEPVFVQGQLLKSISAALTTVGFDSAKPTALEMFRGAVEEYMLQFLHFARTSMHTNRRTTPTALDFASALSCLPNASSASRLRSQLRFKIPESISSPSIDEPDPPLAPAPDFTSLLQPLVTPKPPSYIPKHFPQLPSQHAWQQTSVFPDREHDARKMRERATEEGIQAEQALRKLAAAAKSGAVKAERRREEALSGIGRKVESKGKDRQPKRAAGDEDMYGDMLKEIGEVAAAAGEEAESMDLGPDGMTELRDGGIDPGMPDGVVVNSGSSDWRRGGKKHFHF